MALYPQYERDESHQKVSHLRSVNSITDIAAYSTFGRLLKTVRENAQQTQEEVVESMEPFFSQLNTPTLNSEMFGNLERGKRYPSFDELLPLYKSLVIGCAIYFTPEERELYVIKAREKMAQKKRRIERVEPEKWGQLSAALEAVDREYLIDVSSKHFLVTRPAPEFISSRSIVESKSGGNDLSIIRKIDTSHILGRDEWVEGMLRYLHDQPRKKVIVVQALTGTGKSSAFKVLEKIVAEQPSCLVLPRFVFKPALDKTSEDHLDSFLASALLELKTEMPQAETEKIAALDDRITEFLDTILGIQAAGKRPILLLDDFQIVLTENGELPSCWQQFLSKFIEYEHLSVLYIATREWPTWPSREQSFIEETKLEPLSPQIGAKLWQNLGFTDVQEELLQQASIRCGGNAGMIELRAKSLKRRRFIYVGGGKSGNVSSRDVAKSENQKLIERLLQEESVFDIKIDIQTREMLEQVVSSRLSHNATLLLDVLSVCSTALPFWALDEICLDAFEAFDELERCSLVDFDSMKVAGRANLLSFVREACLHKLIAEERVEAIEQQVLKIYEKWLLSQDFSSDQEKSAVVSELVFLYIKHNHLIKAGELFTRYGWLCTIFGQVSRLIRIYESSLQNNFWKSSPTTETGVLLLRYQLAQRAGKKIDTQQQYSAYQRIHEYIVKRTVELDASTEVHLAHHLMLIPMRQKHFVDAYEVLNTTFRRISRSGTLPAEAHASFLYSKARLLARWGEDEEKKDHIEESKRLKSECISALAESIKLWRNCQVDALPLQRRYIEFRLARSLNDYAYRQRINGNVSEAEQAIRECLDLKRDGATLPKSMAVSLSEYSQILAALGRMQEALASNEQALNLIENLMTKDNDAGAFNADKGMLVIERGDIYVQQARLEEAEQLYKLGKDLTVGSGSRQRYYELAERRLEWLHAQHEKQIRYQLDTLWFERYQNLVAYDDLDWLIQSGPFTEQEQEEWNKLIKPEHEKESRARISELLVQSRQRELTRSIEEEREPILLYPKIPITEVEERIHGLEALKHQIGIEEPNVIVRCLYSEALDEHLSLLKLFKAIYSRDLHDIEKYNQMLYGRPSVAEMKVALSSLFSTLEVARTHPQASLIAERLLSQLRHWHLFSDDFLEVSQAKIVEPQNNESIMRSQKCRENEKKVFSSATVQRFFQDVFNSDFHIADWNVVIEPARDNTYIDVDVKVLSLPARKFSVEKIRQLLAEEIETHAFRSLQGRKSPLALLASGTAKYNRTEEGLANYYIQKLNTHLYGKKKNKEWIGTLAIGLIAGVVTPPLTFRSLCGFLEMAFLVRNLVAEKYNTYSLALEAAKQEALKRATRTVRGVTDLTVPGLCSYKDRIYLRGYLDVQGYLEQNNDIQQLYVGKVGVEQVEAMKELHILRPSLPHRELALDLNLYERIASFEEQ